MPRAAPDPELAADLSRQLGAILAAARDRAGLSRRELARRLEVSDVTLAGFETGTSIGVPGRRGWTNHTLAKVADLATGYGVDVELVERRHVDRPLVDELELRLEHARAARAILADELDAMLTACEARFIPTGGGEHNEVSHARGALEGADRVLKALGLGDAIPAGEDPRHRRQYATDRQRPTPPPAAKKARRRTKKAST